MIDGLQFEGAADSVNEGFFNICVFKQRHGNGPRQELICDKFSLTLGKPVHCRSKQNGNM